MKEAEDIQLTAEEKAAGWDPCSNPEAWGRAWDKVSAIAANRAREKNAKLEDVWFENERLRMNSPRTIEGRLAFLTHKKTIIFVDGADPFEDQEALNELAGRSFNSAVNIIAVKDDVVTIINKPRLPFEDEIPEMPINALKDFVGNWFWEIPLESTPDKQETLRLIAIIEARKDVENCQDILRECREYLSSFYPDDPNKKLPLADRVQTPSL